MRHLTKQEQAGYYHLLEQADPFNQGFELEDHLIVATDAIFSYRIQGNNAYDLCVVSTGDGFALSFLKFIRFLKTTFEEVEFIVAPGTKVDSFCKKRYTFDGIEPRTNRNIYLFRR